jgi:alanyl-tRNA synthetase
MRTSELRERYLSFFAERRHKRLPSSSLVPSDPTLLFTAAGMVPFKDIFWGRVTPSFDRATTCQKCFRTTDIENVGKTAYHNTFFEMLGNFSFGAYFKEGAIELAWEFLTKELGVPGERLTAAVYRDDDEAHDIWRDVVGLPEERIVRLGKEHNWWGPVGTSGPCGPDSEIHFDAGEEYSCGPDCLGPACDCNRFNEIWNLVFMEYDAQEDGTLKPLMRKNIDTGMGVERTTAVLQSAASVFEIDVFRPITEAIAAASSERIAGEILRYRNVVADHLRSMPFLASAGVMPGNERQGYVMRMLLRRAVRSGEKLGLPAGALPSIVDAVIESMGDVYPEIVAAREVTKKLVAREEETFRRTVRDGERRLTRHLEKLRGDGETVLPGDLAFELSDTYGFPLEMIQEIAADEGFTVDLEGFEKSLEAQRKRSRKTLTGEVRVTASVGRKVVRARKAPTRFVGYETSEVEAVVDSVVFSSGKIVTLVVSESPFYAEAGGQVADTGRIENLRQEGSANVTRVLTNEEGDYLHDVAVTRGTFEIGDRCRLSVDVERRRRIERNHTATHLLHAALRQVLGTHAAQAGSVVNDRELRFDFSHFEAMSAQEIKRVEDIANAAVLADRPVTTVELPPDEAKATGAIGLFEDEYRGRETVRVVSVEGASKELCGGTHVRRSGEIGLIKILSEESIAAGVRRIRAITGDAVLDHVRRQDEFARRMRESLGDDPAAGAERLKERLAALEEELRVASASRVKSLAESLAGGAEDVSGTGLLAKRADVDADALKELADLLEERIRPGVVVLVGDAGGRGVAVCKISKGVKGPKAGDVVRAMSGVLGGGGGGGPAFAQGGGTDVAKLDAALAAGADQVRAALA